MITLTGTSQIVAGKAGILVIGTSSAVPENTKIYLYCSNTNVVMSDKVVLLRNNSTTTINYVAPTDTGFEELTFLAVYENYNTSYTVTEAEASMLTLSGVSTIKGGNSFTLTITIDNVQATDQTVTLQESNDPAYPEVLGVPSVATILLNTPSITSTITTKTVTKDTPTTIICKYKGITYIYNVIVTP
jgi:hypothetical protein